MDCKDKVWFEHREKFADRYDDSNYTSALQSFVMRASHQLAEKPFGNNVRFERVLEIGAGTGEHFPYVKHKYNQYILTDFDSKILNIAKEKLAAFNNGKMQFDIQLGEKLSYEDNSFDRVIAVHVLEHIIQPHLVVTEWCRVLKEDGVLTVLIPTDPGVAWRLGRNLGPRKNAVSQGFEYDYLMAREHVNSCNNLIAILRHFFPGSKESWWPFPIPSMDINLFFGFQASIKKGESIE